MENQIGNNAGIIYSLLRKNDMNISQIIRRSNIDSNLVYFSLGWLFREGKIITYRKKREVVISIDIEKDIFNFENIKLF